ncbi:hypothetical protein [Bacillus wiedmannii]|uniref:hypothetical protein n=1 Tax=Bacillus wiedmannii TaxID=1890302 RepID=UPI00159BDB66|nr:hypothetical protein [Bacillus wiedmannii]
MKKSIFFFVLVSLASYSIGGNVENPNIKHQDLKYTAFTPGNENIDISPMGELPYEH